MTGRGTGYGGDMPAVTPTAPSRAADTQTAPRTVPATPVVDPDARPDPSSGDGDHDRFTHYVAKRQLEKARRKGTAVTALCGKRWRPDGDPSRYPMCPTCSELAAELLSRGLGGSSS
jgi:hypothetical protein